MSTRETIVETADTLFYEQGFAATSFADIAAAVGISRGNFYHHFKTKDDILDAVIERRIDATEQKLQKWETAETPAARIIGFVNILISNQTKIMAFGCPVGTLSGELAKLNHDAKDRADQIFGLFRHWLKTQFTAMGRREADALALHVLSWSQGVAAMANAFRDPDYVNGEVARMTEWVTEQAEEA